MAFAQGVNGFDGSEDDKKPDHAALRGLANGRFMGAGEGLA